MKRRGGKKTASTEKPQTYFQKVRLRRRLPRTKGEKTDKIKSSAECDDCHIGFMTQSSHQNTSNTRKKYPLFCHALGSKLVMKRRDR